VLTWLQYGISAERDNVALFVCLEAPTGEQFCVGTVHLYWGSHCRDLASRKKEKTQRSRNQESLYGDVSIISCCCFSISANMDTDPSVECVKLLQARYYITELHKFAQGLPIIGMCYLSVFICIYIEPLSLSLCIPMSYSLTLSLLTHNS